MLIFKSTAVKWVRNNIAAFSGEPSRISLIGHSAGSISGDNYGYAFPDDPIAIGIILTPGTAETLLGSEDYIGSNFTYVAS
jgi:acetylcholinesterase